MSGICDNKNCTNSLPEEPYVLDIEVKTYRPKPLGNETDTFRCKSYCSLKCCKEVLDRIHKAIE